jgi:hypothetical protein
MNDGQLYNFDHGFGDTRAHIPPTQVESLSLPELMKNPHVQTMYDNWKNASAQVVESAQMQQSLWKENKRLNDELQAKTITM